MAERRVSFIIGANIDQFKKGLDTASKRMDRFARTATGIGSLVTKGITVPLTTAATAAGWAAINFEDAFAGVRKTVDATEAEFSSLRSGILRMSKELPTSANEIAEVAEAAGQLGIQTDNVLEFSRVMVMLGDTTNMAAHEAAMNLARFANIMQVPQDQFDRIGATIVDLGNNFATTESEITEFATRLAGAGQIAGMTASDVFGIATAMSSVGVQAEAGGTAVQKALISMNTAVAQGNSHLATFAETAGMSSEEFQRAWRDDAGQAFAAFVTGLGRAGDNAVGVLSQLGLADQRLIRSFLSLANAGDLVTRAINTGTQAWSENTALVEEANERYKTVASRLAMFRNRVQALAIAFGDRLLPHIETAIDYVESLTERFESMSQSTIDRLLVIGGILAASGPIIVGLGMIAGAISALTSPIGLVIASVGALSGGILYVYDNWNAIVERVSDISWWRNALIDMIQFFIDWNPFAMIWRAYNSLMDLMGGAQLADPFEFLSESLEGLKTQTKEYEHQFKGFWESIASGAAGLAGLDFSATDSASGAISPSSSSGTSGRLQGAMSTASGAMQLLNNQFSEAAGFFVSPFRRSADSAIESILEIGIHVDDTGKKMQDFTRVSSTAWDNFVQSSKEAGFDFVSFLTNQVSGAFSSFAESVGMAMSGTENSFATGLEKILLMVTDFAKQLGQVLIGIGTAIMFVPGLQGPSGLYLAGGAALTALATGVSAGIEKRISNREMRATNIPKMATGGIVPPGFPNDTYPAFLSSGEAVIPAPHALPTGRQVIENVIVLDSDVVYRNQREVAHRRGR